MSKSSSMYEDWINMLDDASTIKRKIMQSNVNDAEIISQTDLE